MPAFPGVQPASTNVSADSASTPPGASPQHLGPFVVRVEAGEADSFRRETGGRAGRIPFTFPVRWFAHPELRAAAARMMGEAAWVPIHESQSFDYRRPLESNVDYRMSVEMSREAKPPRLILRAEVVAGEDELCLTAEMILRIVSMEQVDACEGAP
ncbi:MAG TPA: hotdog fold domain-containing protein [Methylovirgula sp.]|nr:hotdog fold domain-containing protein [Methylovirgula sp.]